jgi:hypothetical protein
MFHNLRDGTVSILPWISQQFTKLVIAQPFPNHRHDGRRQMPAGRSRWHVQANQVVVLVAAAAFDRVHAKPIGATPDLHGVTMAIVSLARIVPAGVAIHTARVT